MGKLTGKVALITGASSGMGAAQARLFIEQGAKVLLCDVNRQPGEALADELGDNAEFFYLDVSNNEQWQEATAFAETKFGHLNILINCAGIAIFGPLVESRLEDIDLQYRVNQLGVLLGVMAVIAPMTRAGGGSIVNIASGAGVRAAPSMVAYSATKWAVRGITKSAASELANFNIRVNTICPGVIDTPLVDKNSDELNAVLVSMTPMGRKGQPLEVAHAALYLASDDASFVTGTDLMVDGGSSV
ncbi:glucose 1-dehydrogenase [Pseudomaricurvus alcaniphilus]|uniref:SDR family NAD(P)-dependent oxidoreductase n=1 Tax=Pseudomaricurvus alcaniphilus TaxID=1166482 RepID=UPI00140D3874|nr:glucose 1-dehydrogenase [Pseudomaricurvus alcaniphilus]NHN36520.1 glucose 1-dehydrogenase [Pseudomaricurvus alcaniphilus]